MSSNFRKKSLLLCISIKPLSPDILFLYLLLVDYWGRFPAEVQNRILFEEKIDVLLIFLK
jgi:hypothetical protein